MRNYYAEFLQTKNSVDTLPKAVSKVSKGQNLAKKQAFDTFGTPLLGVYQKNNDELAEIKTNYFHKILNRFIENGVKFDVSADDFLFIDKAQTLSQSDMEFLTLNRTAILCQLQQSLLIKHLFSHSPEQFEDFACDIAEREAIMTGDGKESFSIHCEAVKPVTRKWFAELLNNKQK